MESLPFKSPETFIDFTLIPSSGEDLPRLKNRDFFFAPAQNRFKYAHSTRPGKYCDPVCSPA